MTQKKQQLEKYSYSKLSTYDQCPMRFKKRYEEKKFASTQSLALELGSIAHKGKELVVKALIDGKQPDYETIKDLVLNTGCLEDDTSKNKNKLLSVSELKEKYYFDWIKPDNKSGMSYEQKLEIYFSNLKEKVAVSEWKPIAVELAFTFLYNDIYLIHGYIDRVDQNIDGDFKITDYKTSKQVFEEKDIKTPLQMVTYDLAIENEYQKIPTVHVYDFIFLGEEQNACSKGYLKRGKTKLDKLFEGIEDCRKTGIYKPKPSPLCHWCEYCKTNSDAPDEMKYECTYFSLWTPTNKTYEVNRKFEESIVEKTDNFWF